MASTGVTGDDPAIASELSGWSRLGENTAWGTSYSLLFSALVNSPPHLANMLGDYSLTGVAVAVGGNGWTYLTEVFELPRSASVTPPAPRPTPPVTAAPVTQRPAVTAAPVYHSVTATTAPHPTPTAPPATSPPTTAPAPTSTTAATLPTIATGHTGSAPTAGSSLRSENVALSSQAAPAGSFNTWLLGIAMFAIVAIAGSGWLVTRRLPHSKKATK